MSAPLSLSGLARVAGDDPVADPAAAGKPFPFSMAFQPIVDMGARQVFAYEALVRGPRGEAAQEILGKLTPHNRFAFDQSSRIAAIELAARLGLVQTGAYLAINFIPGAVGDPAQGARSTLDAARRVGLPPDRLIFEVTEGEEAADPGRLRKIFDVYQQHGFLTALDDFGSGSSTLSLLAECQPRIVKLDMTLVRNVDGNLARTAIAHGVQSICQKLGIDVIAKGVESWAEHQALEGLGFHLFQGFLYAEPAFEALPPVHCLRDPAD
jgi:EAL domain-containing protein (putative c-di-GMP-specific phosphodiesterase class I)